MSTIIIFIQKAIAQGMCILFGANGEILTEKSGNLNLGVPGMMYMGGISGLAAAFMYERAVETPNAFIGFMLALLAALAAGALGGLIYSVLTISLRANQNVSGADDLWCGCGQFLWRLSIQAVWRCGPNFGGNYSQCISH